MAFRALAVTLLILAIGAVLHGDRAAAGEDWLVRSFDGQILVAQDGAFSVTEDIVVDFGDLPSHGIYRDLPMRYRYDDEHDRVTSLWNFRVDNGSAPVAFESSREGDYLRLKIGDPDVEVTGVQHYRITYTVEGALNAFDTHDELYWNVTGDRWDVPLQQASATVTLPGRGIEQLACYQGPTGSTETCNSEDRGDAAIFSAGRPLQADEQLTVVLGMAKGLVNVAPATLVDKQQNTAGRAGGYFEISPIAGGAATGLAVLVLLGLARAWWLIGRDRWYGDNYYVNDPPPGEGDPKPLFAHQTIVVQYTPPEVGSEKQRLRPAEIGLLVDERADTLDVSATIVDLAVRKFLQIKELPTEGVFGKFKSQDYELEKLDKPGEELLPYERRLLDAIFAGRQSVALSDLKFEFHNELHGVQHDLYEESVKTHKFFSADPESVRGRFRLIGIAIALAGGAAGWLLGAAFGGALIGVPVVLGGGALFLLAPLMPRRTAHGWEVYRRCLGFRLYMVTAETDRQKFAEQANIFHEYLPYAIVFGCVKKWADAFEGLELERSAGYYAGTRPFNVVYFAESMRSFSTSLSGVMAATPGGSGGSGFSSGGGFSGGGLGGGGGGRW